MIKDWTQARKKAEINQTAWVFKDLEDINGGRGECGNNDLCCISKLSSPVVSKFQSSDPRIVIYQCNNEIITVNLKYSTPK